MTTPPAGSIDPGRVASTASIGPHWYGFRWNGKGTSPAYFSFPSADELILEPGDPVAVIPKPGNGSSLDSVRVACSSLNGAKLDGIGWLRPGSSRPDLFHVRDGYLIWTREATASQKEKVALLDALGFYSEEERALLIANGLLPNTEAPGPAQAAESTKPPHQEQTTAEGDSGSMPMVRGWPELPVEALYGLAGEVVKTSTEHSEADQAAVLITFLTWFGATVGYKTGEMPYFYVGDTQHAPRLYAAVVGRTARARKGTSASPVKRIMAKAGEQTHVPPCQFCEGPLSSGEGIIYRLRDESEEVDKKTGEPVTPGAEDKRLMLIEGELGSAFKVAERAGNIVSTVLRVAWDGGVIEPLTKNARLKSSYPHLAIVGHITHDELKSLLTSVDLRNGLANRFLWVCARRGKTVALPKRIPDEPIDKLASKVTASIDSATPGPLEWSASTIEIWEKVYPVLTQDRPGAWGYATARAEAQVVRLALIYALLDKARTVTPAHLTAACAVWQYCDQSAAHIFGAFEADPIANKILEALANGELSQTDIKQRVLQGHVKADALAATLQTLQDAGRITQRKESTSGRPTVFWRLSDCVKSVKSVKSGGSLDESSEVPDLIRLIRFLRTKGSAATGAYTEEF